MSQFGRRYFEKKLSKIMSRPGGSLRMSTKEVEKFGPGDAYENLIQWANSKNWCAFHVCLIDPIKKQKEHSTTIIASSWDDLFYIFRLTMQTIAQNMMNHKDEGLKRVAVEILRQYKDQYKELEGLYKADQLFTPKADKLPA